MERDVQRPTPPRFHRRRRLVGRPMNECRVIVDDCDNDEADLCHHVKSVDVSRVQPGTASAAPSVRPPPAEGHQALIPVSVARATGRGGNRRSSAVASWVSAPIPFPVLICRRSLSTWSTRGKRHAQRVHQTDETDEQPPLVRFGFSSCGVKQQRRQRRERLRKREKK